MQPKPLNMKSNLVSLIRTILGKKETKRNGPVYLLTAERSEYISGRLTEHMVEQRPFLKVGYSIKDLSEEINVPGYQLSAFLNRQKGLNFNDYLNQFRVRYCEEVIRNGDAEMLNLKGIAYNCGFNNRNTFTKAFKKFTGYTPSDYKRQCKDPYNNGSLLKTGTVSY